MPGLDSDFDKFMDTISDNKFLIEKHRIRMKLSDQQKTNLMKNLKEKIELHEKLVQEGKLENESEVQELKKEILELKNQVEDKNQEKKRISRDFHTKLDEVKNEKKQNKSLEIAPKFNETQQPNDKHLRE